MTTKFIPNANRSNKKPSYQPYVPQYKLRGLEPEDFVSSKAEKFHTFNKPILVKGTPDLASSKPTFRGMPSTQNVPFAETVSTQHSSLMPNVGNNNETNWSGVDQFVVDDMEIDNQQMLIDNNQFIDVEAASLPSSVAETSTLPSVEVVDNDYLLVVEDNIIAKGSRQVIEEQVRQLVFGEHELCDGKQIPAEDLMVLKRIPIKVGVFLE